MVVVILIFVNVVDNLLRSGLSVSIFARKEHTKVNQGEAGPYDIADRKDGFFNFVTTVLGDDGRYMVANGHPKG